MKLKIRDFETIIMEGINMAYVANLRVSKLIIPLYIQKSMFQKMINQGKRKHEEFSEMESFMGISVEKGDDLEIVIKLW